MSVLSPLSPLVVHDLVCKSSEAKELLLPRLPTFDSRHPQSPKGMVVDPDFQSVTPLVLLSGTFYSITESQLTKIFSLLLLKGIVLLGFII